MRSLELPGRIRQGRVGAPAADAIAPKTGVVLIGIRTGRPYAGSWPPARAALPGRRAKASSVSIHPDTLPIVDDQLPGLGWELVCESPSPAGFLKVRSRTYRYPDGRQDQWDILSGPRTVAVVALTDDRQGVLARQFRPGPGRVLDELPGGIVEPGEDVEAAAARELLEETGYRAGRVEVVMRTYLASYATHVRHAVVAWDCRKVAEPALDAAEFIEPVTLPIGEYVRHVLTGELTDADMGLAGLFAAGLLTPAP